MNYSWYDRSVLVIFAYMYCSCVADYVKPNGPLAITGADKRSAEIIGVSILVGMRAVKELLAGATRISSASPVRQFVKSGGYEQAVDDFHRIHPSFVHSFEISSDTFVTAGRVGDRQLILRHTKSGEKRKPTLEIIQMKSTASYPGSYSPNRQSIMSKIITDEITYVD